MSQICIKKLPPINLSHLVSREPLMPRSARDRVRTQDPIVYYKLICMSEMYLGFLAWQN